MRIINRAFNSCPFVSILLPQRDDVHIMCITYIQPASRMIAATHVAQYEAIQQVLNDKGVSLEQAKADPTLLPELEAAAASAGE